VRLVECMLDLYRDQPALSVFLVEHQARFLDALPADFPYPLHVVERLVRARPFSPWSSAGGRWAETSPR
jgi:hypothetical protein